MLIVMNRPGEARTTVMFVLSVVGN